MATATVMAAAATTTTTTALSKIERAHQMYREGRHEEALGLYTEALAMAKTKAQKIALHSNRAACYLKLQDFKKVGLLNQESLIDTVQNAIESKLMNSNTTRIFQIQAVSSSFASQFNSRKDTDCNTSLPGPRSFTFPPSCGVRSAKCEVRSARSRFTTLHEGSFSLCVYIKRERRGDATNDKRRAEERERERESARETLAVYAPRDSCGGGDRLPHHHHHCRRGAHPPPPPAPVPAPMAAAVAAAAAAAALPCSLEDPSRKVRKPYTITKSRENWSDLEHGKFVEALHLFDRDWKKIKAFVGSKTVIQVLLLMRNLSANLTSPNFEAQRRLLSTYGSGAEEANLSSFSNLLQASKTLVAPLMVEVE